MSALMYASQQGHANVISSLLSMGAKVNEQDKVVFWGHFGGSCCFLLIFFQRGDSPFDYAWVNKKTDAQKVLLSAGAQVRPQKCVCFFQVWFLVLFYKISKAVYSHRIL